jgi:ABC-2 type transport system permease protein
MNHFLFELRTGIRNRQLLLMNYLFPLGFYLMMGFIMPAIDPGFVETMVPSMVVFAILAATFLGLPDPLVSARLAGIFRSYRINGVPAISILTIPALATLLHLTIGAALITASAPLLFSAPLPTNWLNYVLIFLAAAFACSGISVLIGVVASSTRMTVLWSQLIFIPSMLLGGLMVPHSILPEVAARISQLLPATQAMQSFTGLAMGTAAAGAAWGSVVVLVVSGVIAYGLAVLLFSWDSGNVTRRANPALALLVLLPYLVSVALF